MIQYDRIAYVDIETEGDEDDIRVGEGFRVSFDAIKTRTTTPNSATIQIWGLADTTRNRILERDALVRVWAGYRLATGPEILFIGNAQRIIHRRQPPDIVTEIELGDGAKPLREARISVSFAPGATCRQVLDDIAERLDLDLRLITDVDGGFPQGFSHLGPAKDALTKVCERFDLEWSIQNDALQVIDRDGDSGEEAILLTPATGLIASPEKQDDTEDRLEGDNATIRPEYVFRCLLQPKFFPGSFVRVESRDVEGNFVIDEVRHTGDTRGQDWHSEIGCRSVDNEDE